MHPIHVLVFTTTAASAITASAAAWFWYLSSKPSPDELSVPEASIDDVPALHIIQANVQIYEIQRVLFEASLLNKRAAIWSAFAAAFGALASVLGST
jgi:hypothetical protein